MTIDAQGAGFNLQLLQPGFSGCFTQFVLSKQQAATLQLSNATRLGSAQSLSQCVSGMTIGSAKGTHGKLIAAMPAMPLS
jgi:hypothetical protein